LFLKGADTSQWEVLKMNEPGLEKAMDTLQYLSQDSEARRLYEARQKYLHDEASMLGSAEMAGIKKVAKNMLDLNLDIAIIAKVTGLTEPEINSMRK
jgi:predicted transposase/invertase (TIGR01784 family)